MVFISAKFGTVPKDPKKKGGLTCTVYHYQTSYLVMTYSTTISKCSENAMRRSLCAFAPFAWRFAHLFTPVH